MQRDDGLLPAGKVPAESLHHWGCMSVEETLSAVDNTRATRERRRRGVGQRGKGRGRGGEPLVRHVAYVYKRIDTAFVTKCHTTRNSWPDYGRNATEWSPRDASSRPVIIRASARRNLKQTPAPCPSLLPQPNHEAVRLDGGWFSCPMDFRAAPP